MAVVEGVLCVGGREVQGSFGGNLTHELLQGVGILLTGGQKLGRKITPLMQARPVVREMTRGLVRYAEVSEEETLGTKLRDGVERLIPQFEINVGRRSGGKNEGVAVDANARGVADESGGGVGIEIGDVVGGVARGVKNLQRVVAEWQNFTPFEDVQIRGGNGKELAEQGVHSFAVKTVRTLEKILRVGHVRGAAGVHENPKVGIFF